MKSKHLVCAAAVLVAACGTSAKQQQQQQQQDTQSQTATIHYIGRFTDETQPRFEWSGSGVVAQFDGTGIAVTIDGGANAFQTYVDGAAAASFETDGTAAKTVTAADGLAAGRHTVEVYRRTEALFDATVFAGFAVTGGDLITSEYPFAHRMMVIGDSISAGYGDQGTLASGCHLDIDTENVMVAYPELAGRALKAAVHVIAWSGKGMYRQYGDTTTPSPDQMPALFERTLPTDVTSTWDHAQYQPQVIVINLGTNDWSQGDPGQPYVTAYLAFLQHLRQLYPSAEIFCTLGPMQTSAPALQHVQDVVAQFADAHTHYFSFAPAAAADGLGCDYHPTQATQQTMADALTAQIHSVMGW